MGVLSFGRVSFTDPALPPAAAPLYDERAKVVSGAKPVPLPEGVDAAEAAKGIPDFWQTVFLRCDATRDAMNEKDVDVLRYLTDVQVQRMMNCWGDVSLRLAREGGAGVKVRLRMGFAWAGPCCWL